MVQSSGAHRRALKASGAALAVLVGGVFAPAAFAQSGNLNIYCSMQIEWCQLAANEFSKQTGIKVAISHKGSGETFAQIRAEAATPRVTCGSVAPETRICKPPRKT